MESGLAAEKVRLYIHTGVELRAGTSYRVCFALSAERAQKEYAVCFDDGTEDAYGTLEGQGIEAGGTDRVEYSVTPERESGELVLRLLLGKTEAEGNKLHFSGLAVEEAPAEETGRNAVVAENLDYSAPGAISFWANDDCKAEVTSDGNSATVKVMEVTKSAEVWKIKLTVATGVIPKPGGT